MNSCNKEPRTGKCTCKNHKWCVYEKSISKNCVMLLTIECTNCGSLWDTNALTREIVSILSPEEVEWCKFALEQRIKHKEELLEKIDFHIKCMDMDRGKTIETLYKIKHQYNILEGR